MSSYSIIFDIDGIIADHTPHNHLYRDGKLEEFHALMPHFEPIPAGVVLFNMLVTQSQIVGHAIQHGNVEGAQIPYIDIITCRPESMREVTKQWMSDVGMLAPRYMHMRDDADKRPPAIIKEEIYKKNYLGKEEVLAVYEDNDAVTAMFRGNGITCYHSIVIPKAA